MPQSLGRRLEIAGAVLLAAAVIAQAGPVEDLKSLSQLPGIDLAKLKSGQIVDQRGAEGGFARGISVEAAYFVPAPIALVGERLLHWDPTKHRPSTTRLYREYSWSSGPQVQAIRLDPAVQDDRWLLDHTYDIANGGSAADLHFIAAEIALIRKMVPKKDAASAQARVAGANDAWGEILRRRSDSLAQGGFAAVAPYGSDQSISPGSEFRGLLTLNRSAAQHFRPVLGAKPLAGNGPAADEAVGYWETSLVRGHNTLQLGLFAAHKSADSWQLVDCVYYPTDTYFMALDLFHLWPVEGGTLVWQVGFVSAPFRSYLGGVDRYIAGKQMTQETLDTIKRFRASFGR